MTAGAGMSDPAFQPVQLGVVVAEDIGDMAIFSWPKSRYVQRSYVQRVTVTTYRWYKPGERRLDFSLRSGKRVSIVGEKADLRAIFEEALALL